MKIHVRFIGPLMYAAGFSEKEIQVPAASTVESVLASLNVPAERPKIVTRNGQAVEPREILEEGDKLAVSPIYSGG